MMLLSPMIVDFNHRQVEIKLYKMMFDDSQVYIVYILIIIAV